MRSQVSDYLGDKQSVTDCCCKLAEELLGTFGKPQHAPKRIPKAARGLAAAVLALPQHLQVGICAALLADGSLGFFLERMPAWLHASLLSAACIDTGSGHALLLPARQHDEDSGLRFARGQLSTAALQRATLAVSRLQHLVAVSLAGQGLADESYCNAILALQHAALTRLDMSGNCPGHASMQALAQGCAAWAGLQDLDLATEVGDQNADDALATMTALPLTRLRLANLMSNHMHRVLPCMAELQELQLPFLDVHEDMSSLEHAALTIFAAAAARPLTHLDGLSLCMDDLRWEDLAQLTALRHLAITARVGTLARVDFSAMSQLESLRWDPFDNDQIGVPAAPFGVCGLRCLTKLSSLDCSSTDYMCLDGSKPDDAEVLQALSHSFAKLPHLQELRFERWAVTALEAPACVDLSKAVAALSALTRLHMYCETHVQPVAPVGGRTAALPQLKHLQLDLCWPDLHPIRGMGWLATLLQHHTALTRFRLKQERTCPAFTQEAEEALMRAIQQHPNLQSFSLSHVPLQSCNGSFSLHKLPAQLRALELTASSWVEADTMPLQHQHLERLILSDVCVYDSGYNPVRPIMQLSPLHHSCPLLQAVEVQSSFCEVMSTSAMRGLVRKLRCQSPLQHVALCVGASAAAELASEIDDMMDARKGRCLCVVE